MAKPEASSRHASRPPLQRMLHIHGAVLARRYPNATSLGGDLEIHPRSIHRDIEFMRDRMGLPIAYDPLHRGFYYTEEVSGFPALQISEGELFALAVAEKALQQYRGTPFERPLMSAFQKISESLPDTISLNLSEWNQSISFRTSAEPILNIENFDQLAQATARREQLRIFYRKPGRQDAEQRVVDPYHLANVNGEWYLFAFDHLRNAIRTFVPGRILAIEKTGQSFTRDPAFSIQDQLRDSFGVHSGKKQSKVVIQFNELTADYIREKKWHPSQRIKNLKTGGLELTLTLSSLVEVERWILAWGGNAKAIAPTELVANVRAAAQRLLERHGGSSQSAI